MENAARCVQVKRQKVCVGGGGGEGGGIFLIKDSTLEENIVQITRHDNLQEKK